ncbi:putative guanine nucleotide exchange factor [Metschnikowia bicuspidata]|uniref:Putative guanine nucleotide exchange factor n=1 Tax=Metschnikowia bicuspidata TaxID=27322 RepID=A0A4P9ZBE1_9ASCO|nr:putative guanine nucleotide exchange factor [Metschnikowia bicuspidata]
MTWTPTEEFLHGRLIRPFLPLEKHPDLKDNHFKNLYPGDEVYVFETKNGKWARGYSLTRAMPCEFSMTSVNLDELPGLTTKVVVFPLKYVKVIERLPLTAAYAPVHPLPLYSGGKVDFLADCPTEQGSESTSENSPSDQISPSDNSSESNSAKHLGKNNSMDTSSSDTYISSDEHLSHLSEKRVGEMGRSSDQSTSFPKSADSAAGNYPEDSEVAPIVPPLPFEKVTFHGDLVDEAAYAMNHLATHIFALYCMGELRLANKLLDVYAQLDRLRVKLARQTLTHDEETLARKTIAAHLCSIPKYLASRAVRSSEECYDLDNAHTDVSANKAVLARDAASGSILSLMLALPSQLAIGQQLCALLAKYPVHAGDHNADAPCVNAKLVREPPLHILVGFKAVSGSYAHQPAGFAGTIAYMYLRTPQKRLTDAFAVHSDSVDQVEFVRKLSGALFCDIPAADIENNKIYLVAVLTEEICLQAKQKGTQLAKIKRGVVAGVTDITRVFSRNRGSLAPGQSHQFAVRLFGSYMAQSKQVDPTRIENNGWGELVDRIIRNSNLGVAINPRAEKLVVYVKEFKHQPPGSKPLDAEPPIPEWSGPLDTPDTPSDAPATRQDKSIAKIWPLFFDPLAENYERLYVKLGKIKLCSPGYRNELLTIVVSSPNNASLRYAKASNQMEQRDWQFVSVTSGEAIGQIVKVTGIHPMRASVPLTDHLVLALYLDGVYCGEGQLLYRSCGQIVSFNDRPFRDVGIVHHQLRSPVAVLQVHTEYIGKACRAEPAIDRLLGYSECLARGKAGLDDLARFGRRFFPELVSAIGSVIDACLADDASVMDDARHAVLDGCFRALAHVLDTICGCLDLYMYLFEQYLRSHSVSPAVGVFLLARLAQTLGTAPENWDVHCRSSCRALGSLVQLALASAKYADDRQPFMAQLAAFCDAALQFVARDTPALVNDQILVMELPDFVAPYDELDAREVLRLVVRFLDAVGTKGLGFEEDRAARCRPVQASKQRLVCVTRLLVVQRLFARRFARDTALAPFLAAKSVRWAMDVFMGPTDVDCTRLAALVMNCVCDTVVAVTDVPAMRDTAFSLAKHLPVVASTLVRYNKFLEGNECFRPRKQFTQLFPRAYPFAPFVCDPVVGDEVFVEVLVELAVVFVYMARIGQTAAGPRGLEAVHSARLAHDFYDAPKLALPNGLAGDVAASLHGVLLIRRGAFFPEDRWLSLYAVLCDGCLCALELLAPLMRSRFVPDITQRDLFDRALWGQFFRNLLRLATLAPASLENLATLPRKACSQIAGTTRDRAAAVLSDIWDALAWHASPADCARFGLAHFGGFQVDFISGEYGVLPDLMLLALQKSTACQSTAVRVLWSMLVSEFVMSDSIVEVQKECVMALHGVYSRAAYKPGIAEQQLFTAQLMAAAKVSPEDPAFALFAESIHSLARFLDFLNDLSTVPAGVQFEDDRMYCELKINTYLKKIGKPELFHALVQHKYRENVAKLDYVQAALCLELLADTYAWDHQTVVPPYQLPQLPQQSAFERKEALVKLIALHYVAGNSLERATDTYNALLAAYTQHTFDLKSFAYVHQKLAQLYLDLESSHKISPSYFKVSYIGNGFAASVRGKQFIMEGLPFEHITAVRERLLRRFPGACIVSFEEHALELQKKPQTGRHIHVVSVKPVHEISDKILNKSIGERTYAQNRDLRSFCTVKKLLGATSVYDLWTEEVRYETAVLFPTLMKRSEIVRTTVVRLSPLENATRSILNKNTEMVQLESQINTAYMESTNYSALLNDLSRQLSGTVDSPVNGGVGQYRAFLTDPHYDGRLESAYHVRLLRSSFHDLAVILNCCLQLHGKLVAPAMRGAHDTLVELFKKNFAPEIDALKLDVDLDYQVYDHSAVRRPVPSMLSVS